jgi:hypothetical protein
MLTAAPLALSASSATTVSPFARTCQGAHLLGKVIRHVNDRSIPLDYRFDEALQLHRTLRALADAMLSETTENYSVEGPPLCTALSICYSAILTLYEAYSCSERALTDAPELQLVMQREAIEGLGEITELALQMARRAKVFIAKYGLANVSPLVTDMLYQAAANCTCRCCYYAFSMKLTRPADAWYARETSDARCAACLVELKEILALVNVRWRVAGED